MTDHDGPVPTLPRYDPPAGPSGTAGTAEVPLTGGNVTTGLVRVGDDRAKVPW